MAEDAKSQISVILLKTRSGAIDSYESHFNAFDDIDYEPCFVPVLEHTFNHESLAWLKSCIIDGAFSKAYDKSANSGQDAFGGIIFTSQRAVEAFAAVINDMGVRQVHDLLPDDLPLYVVGPATAKGVKSLGLSGSVLGQDTGNGEALAAYMLKHYNELHDSDFANGSKLPLLFLVGDQRRDIIPSTLMSANLQPDRRIEVVERVVYKTKEMTAFEYKLELEIDSCRSRSVKVIWLVVFSPTGCQAMLRVMNRYKANSIDDATASGASQQSQVAFFVATIGPTTRDYLVQRCGYLPHASADEPSAQGVENAIRRFMSRTAA